MRLLNPHNKSKKRFAWLTLAGIIFASLPLCELSACHPSAEVPDHHQTEIASEATAESGCHDKKPKADAHDEDSSADDCAHCVLQLFAQDGDSTQSNPTKHYRTTTSHAKILAQSLDSAKDLSLAGKNGHVVQLPVYYFYTSLSLYDHSHTRTHLFAFNSTWLI